MNKKYHASVLITLSLLLPAQAFPFCGFYAGKADAKLFNNTSRVVIARDGDQTVLTMENDYKGDASEFAMIIPVPGILKREQIKISNKATIDYVDAYSAPRLAEYFDPDPCKLRRSSDTAALGAVGTYRPLTKQKTHGVKVEVEYSIGEYDIVILSGEESNGIVRWLNDNGYTISAGAENVINSYLKQDMFFFVAKVNIEKQEKSGYADLRPLQISYTHPRFMLPIRLGMVNADKPQELYVYIFTRNGRVETTNYKTVRIPTDIEVPLFVKNDFGNFYKAVFDKQVANQGMRSVFLEYAWNMKQKCDPCVEQPLSTEQLHDLGIFWVEHDSNKRRSYPVFITRLHLRYDRQHFPADLMFQETADQSNFQGRYVVHNPWRMISASCPERRRYDAYERPLRAERHAKNMALITNWEVNDIREKSNEYLRSLSHPEIKKINKR